LRLTPVTYKLSAADGEPEAIMKLAMDRVEGNLNQWIVDYLPVRGQDTADGERAALLALAPRDRVLEHLEILRHAGLQTEALEIGPVAIRRVVTAMNSGDIERTVLVINFARQNSYLTVVSGRRLILDREVDCSENKISEELGESLDMTPDSALGLLYRYGVSSAPIGSINGENSADSAEIARAVADIVKPAFLGLAQEVRKVLAYTASQMRGASIDQIYLLGAIGRWPGADALLGTILSLDVHVLNPFGAFVTRTDAAVLEELEPVAGMVIATGCALRTASSHV
jgi:Tfp pilus assembly PilM family ATPase